ncbi:MAG: IS200/IS605 family transposase, partial [Desulfobacteraceae bacterium]|nr:IS200/IS605 family transposase [Desulfobacteraceae bacterium]
MSKRWRHSDATVYTVEYILVWCTKYGKEVFGDDETSLFLKKKLLEKAKDLEISIKGLSLGQSDVELHISVPPTDSPHYIVQQLKAHTYRELIRQFPYLKSRMPSI